MQLEQRGMRECEAGSTGCAALHVLDDGDGKAAAQDRYRGGEAGDRGADDDRVRHPRSSQLADGRRGWFTPEFLISSQSGFQLLRTRRRVSAMVESGLTKDASSITPAAEPRTYTCYPWWLVVLWVCSGLWPFAIVFGGAGRGQFQWWALALLGGCFPWYSMGIVRTVKWSGSKFELKNLAATMMEFDLSVVSSVETAVGCGGCSTLVRFRFKEEYTQEQKLKAGQGACCVKGYVDASFMAKGAEMERLVADLGLVNSQV
jgi:hypothetical protein